MLKYLYTREVFQEVPEEMSLAIAISGCRIRCKGCHSRELWEDKGEILDVYLPYVEKNDKSHKLKEEDIMDEEKSFWEKILEGIQDLIK